MQLQRAGWKFSLGLMAISIAGVAACGSSGEAQRDDDAVGDLDLGVPMNTSYKPGSRQLADSEDSGDGMQVEMEHGTLDQYEVEETIRQNFRKLTRCYDRAGDAQRYVEGQITLRFLVEPDGAVSDVLVIENQVGSYPIERCLIVELRDIHFRAPGGRKGATFEYPLRFQSTREMAVVDWPGDMVREEMEPLMASLTPCPPLGGAVMAVAYIEPNGQVGSIGLESSAAIDPEAGMCALEQIQAWRLPGEPGHVVRTRFRLRVPDATKVPAVESPAATPAPVEQRAVRKGKGASKKKANGKRRRARNTRTPRS